MTDTPAHVLSADAIRFGLRPERVGAAITVLPEVASTNTYALETLARGDGPGADGHVVFAEHQTAGRGRLGRDWHCPRGAGLTMTALLWETVEAISPARYVMAAAIAVADAVAETTDVDPSIRWPNDIYVADRKLAGILVEARSFAPGAWAVAIGIGLNCLQHAGHFPPEIRNRATSLEIESGHAVDRTAVARTLVAQLDALFGESSAVSDVELSRRWSDRSADLGSHVTLVQDGVEFTGRIVDVDPQNGLLLQLDTGGRRYFDAATTTRA